MHQAVRLHQLLQRSRGRLASVQSGTPRKIAASPKLRTFRAAAHAVRAVASSNPLAQQTASQQSQQPAAAVSANSASPNLLRLRGVARSAGRLASMQQASRRTESPGITALRRARSLKMQRDSNSDPYANLSFAGAAAAAQFRSRAVRRLNSRRIKRQSSSSSVVKTSNPAHGMASSE